ncbi:MAG TPA: ATP-binding protein [Terriglobales bacterium]|nr:ATP-binding protein [Terriglobales bacterium]
MTAEIRSGRRLRVLFVEDSRADIELSCKELQRDGFDVQVDATDRQQDFARLISQHDYDIVITDYGLPGWTGLDAIRILRETGRQTPVILLTGSLGDQMAVQCIKAGASDYVLKENLARLPHAVKLALRDMESDRRRLQAESKLKEYAAQLERSNLELQEFLSIASHDMQEPLRKIRLFIDQLQAQLGRAADDAVRHSMSRIGAGAVRMAEIIEALLSYSQIAAQTQPFTRVNLSELVAQVSNELSAGIQAAAAQVEVGELPTIRANRVQMYRLFYNLLSNALSYRSPERAPRIQVGSRSRQDGYVELFVSDNGIGFEEQYADRIFRPFQRLHVRENVEGTGIGLAICRKIAVQHRGTIQATSQPGQGSRFTIILPTDEAEAARSAESEGALAGRR